MAIPDYHRANFNTLSHAFDAGRVVLVEAKDKATREPVFVVCLINKDGDEFDLQPVCKMFNGNPYEELIDPQTAMAEDQAKR